MRGRSVGKVSVTAIVAAAVIVLVAIGAILYYIQVSQPVKPREIVIGASLPLTGKFAKGGKWYEKAYKFAEEQINAKGGILGMKVRIIILDDRSDPTTAANNYEKLITEDKIVAALGPFTTACTVPSVAIVEKYKVPMVAGGSASASLYQKGYRYYFGVFPPTDTYISPMVSFLESLSPKPQSIAISYELTDWGKELSNLAKGELEKKGFKVVFFEGHEAGATDYAAMLSKIKAVNPDVFWDIGHTADEIIMARQSAELKFNPKMWVGTLSGTIDFAESLGNLAEGVVGIPAWDESLNLPGVSEFISEFKKKYGVEVVDYHAAMGYAAAQVLFEAIKKAGSTDPQSIRDALTQIDMVTVIGRVKFDSTGRNVYATMYITQIQGGRPVVVWPLKVAGGTVVYPKPLFGE